MPYQERTDEEGTTYTRAGGITIGWGGGPAHLGNKLLYGWYTAVDYVRTVVDQPGDLVTGAGGPAGPVRPGGHRGTMSPRWAASRPRGGTRPINMLDLAALIAVNLAVMNLLPIPPWTGDGSSSWCSTGALPCLFRGKDHPKYEGYVHMAGLALPAGPVPGW